MPAGLDGNPEPVTAKARSAVLRQIADLVESKRWELRRNILVAIDGASGTGKSTLGDEISRLLENRNVPTVRSTMDWFHRPRNERYRQGKTSAVGYYYDSHDLDVLRVRLLGPIRAGDGTYITRVFDEPSDGPIDEPERPVPKDIVLIFDGIFLLRSELAPFWDISVYLIADRRRENTWQQYLTAGLPEDAGERAIALEARTAAARRTRYVEGHALYERLALPADNADLVIDNDDFSSPLILRRHHFKS